MILFKPSVTDCLSGRSEDETFSMIVRNALMIIGLSMFDTVPEGFVLRKSTRFGYL